jgi:2-C-methyl-D-erythritol 4-phosphate cytidylyltransferase
MIKTALIVAGGLGKRMGGETPKQFLPLKDKPLLMWTISAFRALSDKIQILIVLHPDIIEQWKAVCHKYHFQTKHEIVEGGQERFDSVKSGLERVSDSGLVAIHDGVRPLVTERLIAESFQLAEQYGSAVPVLPLNETLREIKDGTGRLIDRSNLFSVQTPQTFTSHLIKNAYRKSYKKEFTDDASVLEAMGESIHFFPGDPQNIKITRQQDLELAERLVEI